MDLRLSGERATQDERVAVDHVCARGQIVDSAASNRLGIGGVSFSSARRTLLLDALWALQETSGGISRGGLDYVCTRLGVAPAEAYGVASAYAMFGFEPRVGAVLHICDDIACRAAQGADPATLIDETASLVGIELRRSPCLGHCEYGSAALLETSGPGATRDTIAPFDPSTASVLSLVNNKALPLEARPPLIPQKDSDPTALRLLRRVLAVDPESLESYLGAGGYKALRKALSFGPAWVIEEVKRAKLFGRGGAAFPTGVKWEAVAGNKTMPHYFVCNADESEPGTFKDRILVENDPFAVVEAVTVAGFATKSARGYVYVRGEYPLAESRLSHAVQTAREAGFLGSNILGAGFDFEIEIRRGAGAYIAGEETALFNSIEGKRPEPRNKPPFPTQSGLFGKPTGANNVETLVNVLDIVMEGGETFAGIGTPDSTGTRLFCVCGTVTRPGLYELPMGRRLPDLLKLAGAGDARPIRAVLLGGAAGMFVGQDELDIELSFEGARAAGVTLGSGVVIVFDDRADFHAILKRIARFFRDESCGQCVPCRVGTVRQEEMVVRLAAGAPSKSLAHELSVYEDLTRAMKDASICGLGQTATGAIESAIRLGLFPDKPTMRHPSEPVL